MIRQVAAEEERYGRGRADRRARPGRVREREPDGAAARRSRPQRGARRRGRTTARCRRPHGRARVLLQRRRRADGPVRRVGRGAVPAGAGSRRRGSGGRLPRRLHRRVRRATSSREHGDALADLPAGRAARAAARRRGRAAPWRGSARRSRGSAWCSTPTSPRRRWRKRARSPRRSTVCARRGTVYEAEGAVWFRSTDFGDDKDRIVIRSNGRHTYFGADLRLRRRQVPSRVRPPDLRLGGGSPRRRRPGEGGGRGARLRSRTRRAAALPVRLVPARRRAAADEQARRARSCRSTS